MKYFDKTHFYWLLGGGWFLGMIWLTLNALPVNSLHWWPGCAIKFLTGLACPSCGITRTMLLVLQGEPGALWEGNPLAMFALAAMVLVPGWIVWDFARGTSQLYTLINRFLEILVRYRMLSWTFGLLIVTNWIWNNIKGL